MKRALIFAVVLAAPACALAQDPGPVFYQAQASGPVTTFSAGIAVKTLGAPVTGAPYSATRTIENTQTLEDGTHITQNTTGSVARDSQGRTRQDASLPAIGNLSATDAPHLVFIQDPVSQTNYTLNLTDKTAQKMPALPAGPGASGPGPEGKFVMRMNAVAGGGQVSVPDGGAPPVPPGAAVVIQRTLINSNDQAQTSTEDLGTQTMEGVQVSGVRTTHTIPAGEMGNDRPISVVTEVWTSPDLKTIVYSKRTDPRSGTQTFQLTNIVRSEPDASLFTVPADFKVVDGPQDVIYRSNQ